MQLQLSFSHNLYEQHIILLIYIIIISTSNCFFFSIIIPIYNSGRYLNDSIGSLINQTIGFKRIQIILVNDGSTDDSEKICLEFKKRYPKNIIYVKNDHCGVSKARNIGLKYASGTLINFLDSDDKWESNAFKYVLLFSKYYKNVDIISGRIKYFECSNDYHLLDYKFRRTRIANLREEYDCVQLHAASSFFRLSSIKTKKFSENLSYAEDIEFILNLLLSKQEIGFIKESIYYYRKRADFTSAIQNNDNENYYFDVINNVHLNLINKSKSLYNQIVPFIQFSLAYELLFRISSRSYNFPDSNNYKKYCCLIQNIIDQIDDKYFLEQKVISSKIKILALSKKYSRDIRKDIIFKNNSFIYSNYCLMDLQKYRNIIVWKILEIKGNILRLEGEDRCFLKREKYFFYCKLGNKIFFANYYDYANYDFLSLYGLVAKGRIVVFDITLEIKEKEILYFYISYMNKSIQIFPTLKSLTQISSLNNSYYIRENYIIKNINQNLIIYSYKRKLEMKFEHQYCLELKKLQKNHIIKLRKKYFKANHFSANKKNQIWLINDKKNKAGDNGEYFFRFLNDIKPSKINFYFIINKNCSDHKRLQIYENVIDPNSSEYFHLFLNSDKIISSIIEPWVNNPFFEEGKFISDLFHFDFIYLTNGIIKDDLSRYLNKIICNIDLIITSSKREYKSIINKNYGYNINKIVLTGLPRFDNLKRLEKNIKKEKMILIFPTWRIYTQEYFVSIQISGNNMLISIKIKFSKLWKHVTNKN